MRSRISSAIERVQAGLLMVPLVSLLLALGLAIVTVWLDNTIDQRWLFAVITDDVEIAKTILRVVAASMLTFTALVPTITFVVLQLAASQYSPRITRELLRDRQTKLSLGLYLGTFAYSLLALRSVRTGEDSFVPAISVAITYLLVFSSLISFIAYIDHISQSMRVSSIAHRITKDGLRIYGDLEKYDSSDGDEWNLPDIEPKEYRAMRWQGPPGVLSHLDERGLARIAKDNDCIVEIRYAVGDFVPHGATLIYLHGYDKDDEPPADLFAHFSIGLDRTLQQDLGLPIRHLVDLAMRALSPGINDPTTAVQVIDYVREILGRLAEAKLPPPIIRDDDDRVLLIVPRHSWDSLVTLAVTELRSAGAKYVQVSRRMLFMLEDLLAIAPKARRPVLEHQRKLWLAATESDLDDDDRQAAKEPDPQGLGVRL